MLFISVPRLEDIQVTQEMEKLLNVYVLGMADLNARTQDQHLVIVYTMADEMVARFSRPWDGVHTYLIKGSLDGLQTPQGIWLRCT